MPITFRVVLHSIFPHMSIVEILKDGAVCAVIYPDNGAFDVKIVSAHFAGDLAEGDTFPRGIKMENRGNQYPPIPCIRINFDPRPYRILDNCIVREPKP